MATNPFNTVPVRRYGRKHHDRSHESINSSDFGIARVVLAEECIPGDLHQLGVESLAKLAPLKAPVFGRIDLSYQFFFVPNRLLYDGWEDFITSGLKGDVPDGTKDNPVAPYFDFDELFQEGLLTSGSVCDDLGLPSDLPDGSYTDVPPINALPFLAYWRIWSDWYRDEQLSQREEFEPVQGGKITGSQLINYLTHWVRPWRKDYFTSARPDTQLGSSVPIPVSGDITSSGPFRFHSNTALPSGNRLYGFPSTSVEQDPVQGFTAPIRTYNRTEDVMGALDLTYASGLSLESAEILINNLRESLAGQRWKELSMRGGNRYIENIFAHFNVRSSDARLQRSQYLGGRNIPVTVGEVLQTVNTANSAAYGPAAEPLGERAGVASSVGRSQSIRHFAEEHGWIICIQTIMPHASYQQGIPRELGHRWSRFQYLWPEFAHLGEQAVKNWELYVAPDGENDEDFGYQPQYTEYRVAQNRIHGDFRGNLNFWTTARIFESRPVLNQSFIQLDGTTSNQDGLARLFAVQNVSHFWVHMWFNVHVLRLLPKYGVPDL